MVHPDGDVYLDLKAVRELPANAEGYSWAPGEVCHLTRDEMLEIFAERGGDPNRAGKRDALDPLLWRIEREGEPSWDAGELGAEPPGLAHRVHDDCPPFCGWFADRSGWR